MQETSSKYSMNGSDLGASRKFFVILAFLILALVMSHHSSLAVRQFPIIALTGVVIYFFFITCSKQKSNRENLRAAIDEIKSRDNLTGLSNRQLFLSSVYQRLKAAEHQNTPFCSVVDRH